MFNMPRPGLGHDSRSSVATRLLKKRCRGLSESFSIIRIEIMDEFSYFELIYFDLIILPCFQ
jgi:hypothetical protein